MGSFKRYDKDNKINIPIKDITFAILEEAHSASGWSRQFGTCFSNECQDHAEEKHLQIFKDDGPEVVLSGDWKSIKYEAQGKYGAKFTAVVYACVIACDDSEIPSGTIVRILLKGCSLGPWIEFKSKKKSIQCNSFKENVIGDASKPDSIKFRSPIFNTSESKPEFEVSPLRNSVIEYLKGKKLELMVANAAKDELPNSSPANETVPADAEEDLPF